MIYHAMPITVYEVLSKNWTDVWYLEQSRSSNLNIKECLSFRRKKTQVSHAEFIQLAWREERSIVSSKQQHIVGSKSYLPWFERASGNKVPWED